MNFIKIETLINKTNAEVQQMYENTYINWCDKWAKELGYLPQALMANTAICNWFNLHYEDLQYQALQTLQPSYGKITIDKARMIYNAIVSDIYKTYSKTLFEAAKTLKITNDYDHTAN